jgi:heme exporter protein CcmD
MMAINFQQLVHVISMGGYGYYVWSAYSITLLVFGINIFNLWQEKKLIKKLIRQQKIKNTGNHHGNE